MQYPMIAQPQYGFAPTMSMMPSMSDMPPGMMGQTMPQMNFKKGGIASLPAMAEEVQDAGRRGDTVLAHITPEEAGILKLLGGSGTINPHTGLPEYGRLSKAWKRITKPIKQAPILGDIYKVGSSIGKELERGVESIAQNKYLGPIAQMASYLHPVSAFLYAGLAPEGSSFDTKRAAKAAAMQQIGEYAVKQMQAQGAPGMDGSAAGTGGPYDISDVGSMGDLGMSDIGTTPYLPSPAEVAAAQTAAAPSSVVDAVNMGSGDIGYTPSTPTIPNMGTTADIGDYLAKHSIDPTSKLPPPPPPPTGIQSAINYAKEIPTNIRQGIESIPQTIAELPGKAMTYVENIPSQISEGVQNLPETISELPGKAVQFAKDLPSDALNYALNNKVNTAFIANQIYAGVEAKKELERQKAEAEKVVAEQEKYTKEEVAFAQDVLRRYPVEYRRLTAEDIKSQNLAGGGLAGLNAFKAGGSPRFLKGGGDGMSDDIPAMIGKQQKAALSDGEFVVPADVVSHLGNGSSRAGAKKLYSMMDNIRQARTGKKRQAPEVKPDRYMPA
jgi:hypothetical protein